MAAIKFSAINSPEPYFTATVTGLSGAVFHSDDRNRSAYSPQL
ncbi:hypothetical protein ABEO75_17580 [Paenibacillus macerans]